LSQEASLYNSSQDPFDMLESEREPGNEGSINMPIAQSNTSTTVGDAETTPNTGHFYVYVSNQQKASDVRPEGAKSQWQQAQNVQGSDP
jgi:hypothetical protein